jgi:hypothetical protein
MNKMENHIIIHELAGARIVAQCADVQLKNILVSLGFEYEEKFYIKQVDSEDTRINIIRILMTNKVLFAEGRDWSPAELMFYYRAKGIINGEIKIISWTKPGEYNIIEK